MDICMTCGTISESKKAWPECPKGWCGSKMLHLGRCMGCGVELGYVIDDDFCSPKKLACGDCFQRAMRKSET